MSNHTPGPWIYSKDERYFPRVEFPAARLDGRYLSINEPAGETMAVYEANACLIAAAPDLLAAMQLAVDCGMVPLTSAADGGAAKHSAQVRVADMIRAAIAKATGAKTP